MVACFICLSLSVDAQKHKTRVYLLGTFHFDNPGLDVAKFENANILSSKRQNEVMEVVTKLAGVRPDMIFVEVPVSGQPRLDSNLLKYKNGSLTLNAGEVHQLGFRLAKALNLNTLYAVDYRDAEFPFDSLVTSMTEAKQFDLLGKMKSSIDSIQTAFNTSLKAKSIRELLIEQNSVAANELQVGWYFDFLAAGKEGNHIGSYLTSEWWRRNMIIYENIMKRLNGNEKTIVVLFGSAHIGILREMMKYNQNFEIIPVQTIL